MDEDSYIALCWHSGTAAVSCSFKAAAGYLYPLERGFMYVHKPPLHIRVDEIASVNFARGDGNTRSFDFEIELKSGTVNTFSSIEKEEYSKLYDFMTSKKIHIKNRGKNDKTDYKDDFDDSDKEAVPDAYLERVKAEGQERDEDGSEDGGSSTDEDFNPGQEGSDVAEEYDSNPSTTDEEGSGSGGDEKRKDKKSKKKEKSAKTVSEKPRKKRSKKEDDGRPKRPTTAFMIWMNENRNNIKADNPGLKITEISKKAGELWKELKDKSEWEKKAAKAKEEYEIAMKEYRATAGERGDKGDKKDKKANLSKKEKPTVSSKLPGKDTFKSKEYISDDDTSSEDEKQKKTEKRKASSSGDEKNKKKPKADKKKSASEENDVGSDSDKKKNAKKDDSDKDAKKKKAIRNKKDSSDPEIESSDEDAKKKKTKGKKDESEEEAESTPASSDASDKSDSE